MPRPDTTSGPEGADGQRGLNPGAKILQFKQALQARTGAMGGWAQERAGAVRGVAERRPMATAGLTAGVALIGGIALGLLLSGQMAGLKRTLDSRGRPIKKARSFFK